MAGPSGNALVTSVVDRVVAPNQAAPSPVRVKLSDPIIADRGRALIVRDRYLAALEDERRPIIVDLNGVHVLTAPAADELLVRWLERARSPRNPLVVAFATFVQDIRETVATSLLQGRQAAYIINSLPRDERWPLREYPDVAGDVTAAQRETVTALARMPGGIATARRFAEAMTSVGDKEMTPTGATNRLNDCVALGLLLRLSQPRTTGDSFIYPWRVEPFVPKTPATAGNGGRPTSRTASR